MNNIAVPVSPATNSAMYYNSTYTNDQYSQVVCRVGTKPGAGIGPAIRISSSSVTRYQLIISSNTFVLSKAINGVFTQLWSQVAPFNNGDTLRLEAQGTRLRAFNNGIQIAPDTTDASIASGYPGIVYIASDSAASADNWDGGNIAPPAYVPVINDSFEFDTIIVTQYIAHTSVITKSISDVFEFDSIVTTQLIHSPITITISDTFEFDSIIGTQLIQKPVFVPVPVTITVNDIFEFDSIINVQLSHIQTFDDILTLTDSIIYNIDGKRMSYDIAIADSLIMNESLSHGSMHVYNITISQDFTINTSLSQQYVWQRQVSDVIPITHNVATNHNALITINDFLALTSAFNTRAPNIVLTTRSGGRIDIKASEPLTTEDFTFNNRYSIANYYTYVTTDTREKIIEFKKFLNYYYNEPIYVNNYSGIFEARLDMSENTRRSMDMFKDDTRIILNFYAIRVG
jgi:hypothetical protein